MGKKLKEDRGRYEKEMKPDHKDGFGHKLLKKMKAS